MTDFLNNGIVQAVLLFLGAVVVLGLFGWLKFRRDEKVVADFLKTSGLQERNRFSTTTEIASATNLHEDRIRTVCKKSTKIKKTHKDEDAWKFHE